MHSFLHNWNLFWEINKFQSSPVLVTVQLVIVIYICLEIVMSLYSYHAWPTWSTTVPCYGSCTHSPPSHVLQYQPPHPPHLPIALHWYWQCLCLSCDPILPHIHHNAGSTVSYWQSNTNYMMWILSWKVPSAAGQKLSALCISKIHSNIQKSPLLTQT